MPSKVTTAEFSFSKRAEFDRCESCFRTAQSIVLLKLVVAFVLFLLILGLDIWKVQTDNVGLFTFILLVDILALIGIGLGIRGVALEKCVFVIIFLAIFFVLIVVHSVIFCLRHHGLSGFTLSLEAFLVLIGLIFGLIFYRFDCVQPSDYKQLRKEAAQRALDQQNEDEEAAAGGAGDFQDKAMLNKEII